MMVMFFFGKSAAATVVACTNATRVSNNAMATHFLMAVLLCVNAVSARFFGVP